MISKRWVAVCDFHECRENVVLEGRQDDGRWELGEYINDHGWQASPAIKETYCPKHAEPNWWDKKNTGKVNDQA